LLSDIKVDHIRLKNKADKSEASGLTQVELRDGATVYTLTANTSIDWQYDFPANLPNGTFDLWIGGLQSMHNGDPVQVRVQRGGNIGTADINSKAVIKDKTNFLVPGDNLFNKIDAVEGSYFSDASGVISPAGTLMRTPYIKIKESTQYAEIQPSPAYGNYYHFFDADYVWISRIAVSIGFTSPAGAVYVGRNLASSSANFTAAKDSYMLAEGSTISAYKSFALFLGDTNDNKYPANVPSKAVTDLQTAPDFEGQVGKDSDNQVYTGLAIGNTQQIPLASKNSPNTNIVDMDSLRESVNSLVSVLKKTAIGGASLSNIWLNTAQNITWTSEVNDAGIVDADLLPFMHEITPISAASPYIRSENMVSGSTTISSFVFGCWLKKSQLIAWANAQSDPDAACMYMSIYDGVTFPTFNLTANIIHSLLLNIGYEFQSSISGGGLNCDIVIKVKALAGDFAYFEIVGSNATGSFSSLYFYLNVAAGYAGAGSIPLTFLAPRMVFDVTETHPHAVYRDDDSIPRTNILDRKYFEDNYVGTITRDKIRVLRLGSDYYIRSYFDDTRDVVIKFVRSTSANQLFNFLGAYLVASTAKDTSAEYLAGTYLHNSGDDITPWYTDNVRYIGANHGINCMNVTSNIHDKTSSDVGSVWSDGTRQWILTEVDGDDIVFLCVEYTSGSWRMDYSTAAGTLIHVSGATNTGNITISSQTLVQKYPIVKNVSYEILIDGQGEINDGQLKYCDFVDFKEIYDIVDPGNISVSHPVDYSNAANMFVRNSILYRFGQNGSCVIYYTAELAKELDFGLMGMLQAGKLNKGSYPKVWGYMPGVNALSGWDFKAIADFTGNPSVSLNYTTSELVDVAKPPNRFIQFLGDASKNMDVAFSHGYNPVHSQSKDADRLNNVTTFWQIATSSKSYPRCYDSKLAVEPIGTVFNAVAYRQYYDPNRTGNASSVHWIAIADYHLVFLDYHANVTRDKVVLPSHLVGKSITVVDKSTSLTLHISDYVPSDGLIVTVTGGYGYAVVKLSGA